MFTAARGWIEIDEKHRAAVTEILDRFNREPYSRGWAIPQRTGSWSMYVLFGADLPDREVEWLRSQVEALAGLPPLDQDDDCPLGLIVLSDEHGRTREWRIDRGTVTDEASTLTWLTERP